MCKLTRESQEPVHRLMPSLLTPKQLTRFSWPLSEPTLSPRSVSQTLLVSAAICWQWEQHNSPCTRNHHSRQRGVGQKQRRQPK